MTRQEEIERVHVGGTHLIILGAGASIASTRHTPEKNNMPLPAMDNIIEVLELNHIIKNLPTEFKLFKHDFEKFYSKLILSNSYHEVVSEIEVKVHKYFQALELPDSPTIYDYLVMSLRRKDSIATFNWDPFLYQAFVRISKYCQTPGIIHLHGCVALGYSKIEQKAGPSGWYSKASGDYFEPTKLLYPVEQKDYNTDEYIRSQWEAFKFRLTQAERVTVFGYRAPESDIEAISIMKDSWGTSHQRNMEQFELIDIREESDVKKSWEDFIHSHHYDYSTSFFDCSIANHPRRSIESYRHWAYPSIPSESFQDGNKVPSNFRSFEEMFEWYSPLIEAENDFYAKLENEKSG